VQELQVSNLFLPVLLLTLTLAQAVLRLPEKISVAISKMVQAITTKILFI